MLIPRVISAASAPASATSPSNAARRRTCTSGMADKDGHRAQCQSIRIEAEAGDRAMRDIGNDAVPAELLTRCHIRKVHLYERDGQHRSRVTNCIGIVRERGRIEYDSGGVVGRFVQPADQRRFLVGLPDDYLEAELFRRLLARVDEVLIARRAVDVRLAAAEPAQ